MRFYPIKYYRNFSLLILGVIFVSACVKSFKPTVTLGRNNYLVVDGFINTAPDGITSIVLTRSRNLTDTISYQPETNAQMVLVDSTNGNIIKLLDTSGQGAYISAPLNLNQNHRYGLTIQTTNGEVYQSAFISSKSTPPIDSITWQQNLISNDVTIDVNTHDPSNNTHYYKWDFLETWQHDAPNLTQWVLVNDTITLLDQSFYDPRQTYQCWTTLAASHVSVANSLGLSQDIISTHPIDVIPYNDVRLSVRYSILVRQYAMNQDAYNYWNLIQDNSQSLGGLFDLIPSQLKSNIKCISNSNEPVIGYLSACNVQEMRLFINNSQVPGWSQNFPHNDCQTLLVDANSSNPLIYDYADTSYAPWYFLSPGTQLFVTKKYCIDCRSWGGSNVKPSFW